MNADEIKRLLERYERGELSAEERSSLAQAMTTTEGRRLALSSSCPEAVFLARDTADASSWDRFWVGLSERLAMQGQLSPRKTPWPAVAAAAAVFALAVTIYFTDLNLFPFQSANSGVETARTDAGLEPQETALRKRVFELRHRIPAEVLPELNKYMSDNAVLNVPAGGRRLEITDYPANLKLVERALLLLDVEPATLGLRVRLLNDNGHPADRALPADIDRQVSRTARINPERYEVREELLLMPTDGSRYETVVKERYKVVLFAGTSPDGPNINLRYINIYDLRDGSSLRLSGIEVTPGEWVLVPGGGGREGDSRLIVAIGTTSCE